MRLNPIFAAWLAVLALPGCAAVSSLNSAARPLEIYELRAPEIALRERSRNVEIVIEEPAASGALATERIMIRPGPLQAQYLPGVQWADPAPAMVQTLLLRSLASTGALDSVGRRPLAVVGDFVVLSELTDFQAESAGEVTVRLRLMVRLVREGDPRVVADRTFEVTEPAASADAEAVVQAFDTAAERLLREFVPWVVANVGA